MSDQRIDEIRRLYYETTAASVESDLIRAVEILKSLPDEDTRARAAVFMDGLSQMRSEWRLARQRTKKKTSKAARAKNRQPRKKTRR